MICRPGMRVAALLTLWLYSVAHAGQVPSLSRDMIPPEMPPEVRRLVLQLYSDSVGEIVGAVRTLGGMGPRAVMAAPFLTSMLPGHFSVEEANSAAQSLVKIGKGAFDAVAAAVAPTSGEARRRAVLVLALIDGPRAVPVLLDVFESGMERDPELVALRRVGEAAYALVVKGLESADPASRRAAAGALPAFSSLPLRCRGISGYGDEERGGYATQAAVDLLLRALGDTDAGVRMAALRSLGRLSACADKKMPLTQALRASLTDANPAVRRQAIGVALRTDESEKTKLDALEPLLADPDPAVRGEAAAGVGWLPGERERSIPLLLRLLRDPGANVRVSAAAALGELGAGSQTEGPLLAALSDEARPVQLAAVAALAKAAGKAGVEALVARAKQDPDPALRLAAVQSLAAIYKDYCAQAEPGKGQKKSSGTFRPEVADQAELIFQTLSAALADPMRELHAVAIESLARTPRGANKDLVPLLAQAIRSPNEAAGTFVVRHFLRGSAIRDDRLLEAVHERVLRAMRKGGEYEYSCHLLASWADPRSFPVFREVLQRAVVKSGGAIGALISAGGAELEFVFKNLGNPKPAVREQVAQALAARVADPKIRDFVRAALSHEDPLVRDGAQRILGRVPAAQRTFEPLDQRLRAAIYSGLQGWRQFVDGKPAAEVAEAAVKLLRDQDPWVRACAAQALGFLRERSVLPRLLEALGDDSPQVRTQILDALAEFGEAKAAPDVARLMQDPEEGVREAAAVALGRLGDPAAIEPLAKALGSPDWHVRRAAAQSLGGFADARAAEALGRALTQDPHWCVRRAAAAASGRKQDPARVPLLIAALADEHWSVRSSAHESLVAVTRQKLAGDPEAWRAWWARQPGAEGAPAKRN